MSLEIKVLKNNIRISANAYTYKQSLNIELPIDMISAQEEQDLIDICSQQINEFQDSLGVPQIEIFLIRHFFKVKSYIYSQIRDQYPEFEI